MHDRGCGKLENLTTKMEVRSFLGLSNVFRPFVSNFARLAAPFSKTLSRDQPKTFGHLHEKDGAKVASLKDALISSPVLALPRNEARYALDIDACDKQTGCVLLQKLEDRSDRSVGFWSRTLKHKER